MTNKEIFHLYEGLCELAENKDIQLTVQASYYLAYDKNALLELLLIGLAIIDTRNAFLDKYGAKTDTGWTVPKEHVDNFTDAWEECLAIEVPLNLKGIELKDIGGQVNLDLMSKLLPLIKE